MAQPTQRSRDLALIAGTAMAIVAVYRYLNAEDPSDRARRTVYGTGQPSIGSSVSSKVCHGRFAMAPWQIPLAGWKDIIYRTYQQINDDRLLAIAAGVVFYGLLALFPAITALVSSYGLFADPSTVQDNLRSLAVMLPADAFGVVQDQVGRVLAKGASTLGWTFIFGFGVALWSANAGTKAIIDALNVVYEEREKRSLLKLNAISIILTLAALITVVLAISAVIVMPLLLQRLNLGDASKALVSIGRWPALAILLLSALAVLYRYGPSRSKPQWQWISVGALTAVILWLGGSATLSWYLSRFGNYTATYGSLGAAIGLMTWMWMSAIVILFGAELNSEIEHQTAVDSTDGKPEPLGRRGAVMADTLGQTA